MMRTLLVLIFKNEMGAQEMIVHVQLWQRQQLINISDAAFIIRQKNEKVKVKQANSLVGSGVFGGAFWGLLIGQYLWVSSCDETDAMSPQGSDCGIDDNFLNEVSCTINPGYSALFMFLDYLTEEVKDMLASQGDMLLTTTLSRESETKLREAFGIVEEV